MFAPVQVHCDNCMQIELQNAIYLAFGGQNLCASLMTHYYQPMRLTIEQTGSGHSNDLCTQYVLVFKYQLNFTTLRKLLQA